MHERERLLESIKNGIKRVLYIENLFSYFQCLSENPKICLIYFHKGFEPDFLISLI